jgi:hypothetical protein
MVLVAIVADIRLYREGLEQVLARDGRIRGGRLRRLGGRRAAVPP